MTEGADVARPPDATHETDLKDGQGAPLALAW